MTRLILWTYSLLACVCWPGRDSSDIVRRNIRIALRIQAVELGRGCLDLVGSRHPSNRSIFINTRALLSERGRPRPHLWDRTIFTKRGHAFCQIAKTGGRTNMWFFSTGAAEDGRAPSEELCVFMDDASVRRADEQLSGSFRWGRRTLRRKSFCMCGWSASVRTTAPTRLSDLKNPRGIQPQFPPVH